MVKARYALLVALVSTMAAALSLGASGAKAELRHMGHEKGLKKAHCDGESSLSVISTATMAIRSPKTEYQYRVRNNGEIAAWMPLTLALKGAARNSNTPGIMRPKVIMVLAPVCSKKWKTAASRMVRAKGTVYRAHRAVYSRAWRIAAGRPGARWVVQGSRYMRTHQKEA